MKRDSHGYTLLELMVAILIFSIVMGLISVSFNRIVSSSGQIIKSAETNIGGLIGLEVMRVDLSNAGLGLPWDIGTASYSECTTSHTVNGIAETEAMRFNDSKNNPISDDGKDHPPRPFVLLNDKGFNGSDYLVLKGTAVGSSRTSRGWSYLGFGNGSTALAKPAKSEIELVQGKMDRVIVLSTGVTGGKQYRRLVTEGSSFVLTFEQAEALPKAFRPKEIQDRYLVYGVAPPKDSKEGNDDVVNFPFNRVDYFLAPSDTMSSSCIHKNSKGENQMAMLYRAQLSQKGSLQNPATPILDCVADMQVVFRLNNNSDDSTEHWPQIDEHLVAYFNTSKAPDKTQKDVPEELRKRVREVRVYVLVQQGKKDPSYLFPVSNPNQAIVVGDNSLGRVWKASDMAASFGDDWRNYHWQVYSIVVETKNLN